MSIDPKFAKLGLKTQDDLRLHLPLRFEDETRITPIRALLNGRDCQIEGRIVEVEVQQRRRPSLIVRVDDDSGSMLLRFLHFYPSQRAQLVEGKRVRAFGEVRSGLFGTEMVHPRFRIVAEDDPLPDAMTPVYPTAAGIGQATLRRAIQQAVDARRWPETIPPELLSEFGLDHLPGIDDAIRRLHRPEPGADTQAIEEWRTPEAQRVAFDELLAQQLSLRLARARRAALRGIALRVPASSAQSCEAGGGNALLAHLPFELTGAQKRAWDEIRTALESDRPMHRLLQGDVGSGKTVIAALAAWQTVAAGQQAAVMAPTEILARQHHEKLEPWFSRVGIRVGWLSGASGVAARRDLHARLASGELPLLIGTHALIEDEVVFDRLGLAIIDEQHRFGVAQRMALRRRGDALVPHLLMMSATPIPRTLAMSYYADLDVSVIDELPPGRQPIRTKLVSDARREEVIEGIAKAIREGRQAYWVCPLVEESEVLDVQNAIDTHALLGGALAQMMHGDARPARVGLVHGRLGAEEKSRVMEAFRCHELDLLVATTVIEVGVDVPNATLMVIEHAERFGLSQLHQLRGRVGRGTGSSVCVLMYRAPVGAIAKERLRTMHETQDGFEIAQRDLQLRGPGDFLGARQSGQLLLRFAQLERDAGLIDAARAVADRMLERHPEAAKAHLERWLGSREGYLQA